jgi:AcrR family transcriptional regulator
MDVSTSISDRRERVLGVAAALFAERGFHGTSVRDIAVACGVRPSSLYNHVADKNDMLVELVTRYFDALDVALARAAGAPGDGASRLAAMIRASLGVAREFPYEFLTLSNSWTYIRRTPELGVLVRRRDADRELWARVLAAGGADGTLRPGLDPDAALRIVFSAIHGSLDSRFDGVAPPPDDPVGADTAVTLLLDGLRARPRPGS